MTKLKLLIFAMCTLSPLARAMETSIHQLEPKSSTLLTAAMNGDLRTVLELIEAGQDVNQVDRDNTTPLINAASSNHLSTVAALLKAGANVNHANQFGYTALHMAAIKGLQSITQTLIDAGADISLKNANGSTALQIASNEFDDTAQIQHYCEAIIDSAVKQTFKKRKSIVTFLLWLKFGEYKGTYPHFKNIFKPYFQKLISADLSNVYNEINFIEQPQIKQNLLAKYNPKK